MSKAYHDRLAAKISEFLPGFEIQADQWLIMAHYGSAMISGWPVAADKRDSVSNSDAREWIQRAVNSLRRDMHHYTPEAREAATALLAQVKGL